jgi:RimJ/RimL family protein N-acetyltransferase
MTAIPTITTARLTLRAPALSDWPAYAALLASPRSRFLGGPYGQMDAWGWFCADRAQWDWFGHGALWLDVTETGETVGQVNIINPPAWPQAELGFMLLDGFEGHGYATEAAQAMRDWYYADHPLPVQLVSYVHPDNAASAAIMAKLGATPDPARPAPLDGYGVFVHPAPGRDAEAAA